MTLVAARVVGDVHLSLVVHPQSPYDNVVHCRCHLAPCVVAPRLAERQVGDTCTVRRYM